MNYMTIFEKTISIIDIVNIIPLLLIALLGFGIIYRVERSKINFSVRRQVFLYYGYIIGGLPIIIFIFFLTINISKIPERNELRDLLKNKKYLTVEGLTENYQLIKDGSNYSESFSVKGLTFVHSDNLVEKGFKQTFSKGGQFEGNGQQVRIEYNTVNEKNLILKLEIAVIQD